MCEPAILERTGLSVAAHQYRTVANYLELRRRGPFIPVLQGWTLADYERCVELYASAGIDLFRVPLVGLGSVCRRHTAEIARIACELAMVHGLRVHGFGVKASGLRWYGRYLASADSLAWSYQARRYPPLRDCSHASCVNCPRYALRWRESVLHITAQLELGELQ